MRRRLPPLSVDELALAVLDLGLEYHLMLRDHARRHTWRATRKPRVLRRVIRNTLDLIA